MVECARVYFSIFDGILIVAFCKFCNHSDKNSGATENKVNRTEGEADSGK